MKLTLWPMLSRHKSQLQRPNGAGSVFQGMKVQSFLNRHFSRLCTGDHICFSIAVP